MKTKHPWTIVAKREILAQLSDKAFWISTITTLAIVVISFVAAQLFANGGLTGPDKVAVATDNAETVVRLAAEQGQNLEAVRVAEDELLSAIEQDQAVAALTEAESGWTLTARDPRFAANLEETVRDWQLQANADELGINLDSLTANAELRFKLLSDTGDDDSGAAIMVASMVFTFIFMIAAMTYGVQIAQSVVTEKESRIVEILAATIPVRQLLIGKVVANSVLALSQVVLLVTAGLVALSFTQFAPLFGVIAPVAGWFVVFFLLGFGSLACLWAAAGAMATRMQDIGQTTTPLMLVIMLVYMAGFLATGTMAKVLSYLPIASTVIMPGRLLRGEAGLLDALLALGIAALFMLATLWFGASIYRRGLLKTNAVMSFKEALSFKR